MTQRKIRILIAKPGLDGHDRGAKIIAKGLKDAGYEVIYTGLHQTPEMIVNAALQEDVDMIGMSSMAGAHNYLFLKVLELLKQNDMADVTVVGGGIIPDADLDPLLKAGIKAIFRPGATIDEVVAWVGANVRARA